MFHICGVASLYEGAGDLGRKLCQSWMGPQAEAAQGAAGARRRLFPT